MGKNIINRPGEHVELENSLCVFPTLASLLKKDFATEPELFWRVKVNPTQGQAATSAPFPHPALPFSKPSTASSWALQGCGEPGLRTLQSKSLCLCLPLLCTSLGLCWVSPEQSITNCLRRSSPTATRGWMRYRRAPGRCGWNPSPPVQEVSLKAEPTREKQI